MKLQSSRLWNNFGFLTPCSPIFQFFFTLWDFFKIPAVSPLTAAAAAVAPQLAAGTQPQLWVRLPHSLVVNVQIRQSSPPEMCIQKILFFSDIEATFNLKRQNAQIFLKNQKKNWNFEVTIYSATIFQNVWKRFWLQFEINAWVFVQF